MSKKDVNNFHIKNLVYKNDRRVELRSLKEIIKTTQMSGLNLSKKSMYFSFLSQ